MSELVSVVIPSYNHEAYIEKAILSVLNQTYSNIELIVIDDGSTDNSDALIQKLLSKHQFIYHRQENNGLINTLNKALDMVQGKYFTMLGSDDFFELNKIERQVEHFKKKPEHVLCYANVNFINSDGNFIKQGKTKHFSSGYVFEKLILQNFIPLPTVMMKTDIAKEFYFDNSYFLEDYPLWLKIAKKYQIGYIKEALTNYRLHENNVSKNLVKMIREVHRILHEYRHEEFYEAAIAKWSLRWFNDLSKTEHTHLARHYMKIAAKRYLWHPRFIKSYIRLKKSKT